MYEMSCRHETFVFPWRQAGPSPAYRDAAEPASGNAPYRVCLRSWLRQFTLYFIYGM